MGKIVAIGGGELRLRETFNIDEYIVKFSGVENPKLLFIPTASYDAEGYIESIEKVYGQELNCEVQALCVINNDISEEEIRNKILWADIIYVGGGDTVKMMEIWREKKIDKLLLEAYKKGTVLSGLSAGSLCWFSKGHGESNKEVNPDGWWDNEKIKGLSLINAIHCPHYNEKGHESFDEAMKNESLNGIALENNCALIIKDNMFRIIKSQNESKAYLLKNKNGMVIKKELTACDFKPINEILE